MGEEENKNLMDFQNKKEETIGFLVELGMIEHRLENSPEKSETENADVTQAGVSHEYLVCRKYYLHARIEINRSRMKVKALVIRFIRFVLKKLHLVS